MIRKIGQMWSMDASVALIVVMVAVAGFLIYSASGIERSTATRLSDDNAALISVLGGTVPSSVAFMKGRIDEQKLVELSKIPYDQVKRELGITTDFCIYFTDSRSNLAQVGGIRFIGSPYINVSINGMLYTCNGTLYNKTQCNNRVDDDLDTFFDMNDPGCRDVSDNTE